jgi:ribosomal protein S18 acetylase RimI-like enzyme
MASELARQHERYDNRRFSLRPMEEAFTDFYRNELDDENSALYVAEIDGTLAGYVFVRIEPDSIVEWFKATGWVHDLFVVRRWRKSHVGSDLLRAGVEHLRRIGSPGVMLAVAAKNGTARRFFKRHGFRVTMHEMRLDFDEPAPVNQGPDPSNPSKSAPPNLPEGSLESEGPAESS